MKKFKKNRKLFLRTFQNITLLLEPETQFPKKRMSLTRNKPSFERWNVMQNFKWFSFFKMDKNFRKRLESLKKRLWQKIDFNLFSTNLLDFFRFWWKCQYSFSWFLLFSKLFVHIEKKKSQQSFFHDSKRLLNFFSTLIKEKKCVRNFPKNVPFEAPNFFWKSWKSKISYRNLFFLRFTFSEK